MYRKCTSIKKKKSHHTAHFIVWNYFDFLKYYQWATKSYCQIWGKGKPQWAFSSYCLGGLWGNFETASVWSQPVKASISLTIDVGVVFSVESWSAKCLAHMVTWHILEKNHLPKMQYYINDSSTTTSTYPAKKEKK